MNVCIRRTNVRPRSIVERDRHSCDKGDDDMPFDVLVRIHEDSQRGRAIQEMADAKHVTPEHLIEQIIDAGIREHLSPASEFDVMPSAPGCAEFTHGKTPAQMLLGLFSSPEDSVLMDEVTAIAYEGRRVATTRDIGV